MAKHQTLTVIFFSLILGAIVVFMVWVFDGVKSPTFSVYQATITDYHFTTDNHLNATFNLVIETHYRDVKYNVVKYEFIMASVYLNEYRLAYDTLGGPYTQKSGVVASFSARPVARNVPIYDAVVAGSLRNETKAGHQLNLEVRIRAAVTFEINWWHHFHYTLKAICTPVITEIVHNQHRILTTDVYSVVDQMFERTNCRVYRF